MEKKIEELLLENKRLRARINYLESAILRGDFNVPLDIISAEKIRIISSSIHDAELSVRTTCKSNIANKKGLREKTLFFLAWQCDIAQNVSNDV